MSNFLTVTTTAMTNSPMIVTTNTDGTTVHTLRQVSMTTYAIGPYFAPVMMIMVGILVGVVWSWLGGGGRRNKSE